jgi:hypothetical protein
MAPKLSFKAQAVASQSLPEQLLEDRAIAADIGWIETSLPGAAAGAIRAVEDPFSAGHAEDSMAICNQVEGVRGVRARPSRHMGDAGGVGLRARSLSGLVDHQARPPLPDRGIGWPPAILPAR